jgi:hypothetical protein
MGGGRISEGTTQHTYSQFNDDGTAVLRIARKDGEFNFSYQALDDRVEFTPVNDTSDMAAYVWDEWDHRKFAQEGQEEPDFSDVKIARVTYYGDITDITSGDIPAPMEWEAK